MALFDGHALGEIAGLIDVAAAAHGDVIGQELQRHDFQNRREQFMGRRDFDDVIGDFPYVPVALGDQRHHDAFARLHFLDVRQRFFVEDAAFRAGGIVRRHDHHRQVLVDEGVGPVLHLPGGITFGVDIGDLLQLERAFESDGEVHAPAEEEEVRGAVQVPAQRFVQRIVGEDGLELAGNPQQFLNQAAGCALIQATVGLAKIHGQDEEGGQLAGEGFGGRHADLGTGVGDDGPGGFTGDHRSHHVADGQRFGAFAFGFALRRQRVGGFARLRNYHGEGAFEPDGIAIAELAAVIDLDGKPRQLFDHELAGESGVPACAAGDDLHLAKARELFRPDIHFIQENAAGLLPHAPQRGIAHGARLLEDLLEHEMLVAALFRHDGVPQNVGDLAVHRVAVEIAQPDAARGEYGHIAVGQEKHVAGVVENGGDVGSDEVLVVPDADHHRRPGARRHDLVGIGARDRGQREHAGNLLHGPAHGFLEVAREVSLDQVRDHFSVRFRLENVAFGLEALFQWQIVLDDSVVHHDHVALAVAMGVGVLFGGTAVSGPAGVADAARPVQRVHADDILQIAQLTLGAANLELIIAAIDGEPSRIVAAVFQPLQPLQNDRHRLAVPDVPDDSTHRDYYRCGGKADREKCDQSKISMRYSSMTGLARTSWAMVSISFRACSGTMPAAMAISKYLPWRTSSMPG